MIWYGGLNNWTIACICASGWMHYKQLIQPRTPDYRLRIYNEHIAFSAFLFSLRQVMKVPLLSPFRYQLRVVQQPRGFPI